MEQDRKLMTVLAINIFEVVFFHFLYYIVLSQNKSLS